MRKSWIDKYIGEGSADRLNAQRAARRISRQRKQRIKERDKHKCRYCGKCMTHVPWEAVIDHIVPVVEGGTGDDDNLTTACRLCNGRKGRKPAPAGGANARTA